MKILQAVYLLRLGHRQTDRRTDGVLLRKYRLQLGCSRSKHVTLQELCYPAGDCCVGAGYRLTTEEPWIDPRQRQEIFLFSSSWTLPPTCTIGTVGLLPVVRRPGCDPENSPPSSTEINNDCSDISTPTYISTLYPSYIPNVFCTGLCTSDPAERHTETQNLHAFL